MSFSLSFDLNMALPNAAPPRAEVVRSKRSVSTSRKSAVSSSRKSADGRDRSHQSSHHRHIHTGDFARAVDSELKRLGPRQRPSKGSPPSKSMGSPLVTESRFPLPEPRSSSTRDSNDPRSSKTSNTSSLTLRSRSTGSPNVTESKFHLPESRSSFFTRSKKDQSSSKASTTSFIALPSFRSKGSTAVAEKFPNPEPRFPVSMNRKDQCSSENSSTSSSTSKFSGSSKESIPSGIFSNSKKGSKLSTLSGSISTWRSGASSGNGSDDERDDDITLDAGFAQAVKAEVERMASSNSSINSNKWSPPSLGNIVNQYSSQGSANSGSQGSKSFEERSPPSPGNELIQHSSTSSANSGSRSSKKGSRGSGSSSKKRFLTSVLSSVKEGHEVRDNDITIDEGFVAQAEAAEGKHTSSSSSISRCPPSPGNEVNQHSSMSSANSGSRSSSKGSRGSGSSSKKGSRTSISGSVKEGQEGRDDDVTIDSCFVAQADAVEGKHMSSSSSVSRASSESSYPPPPPPVKNRVSFQQPIAKIGSIRSAFLSRKEQAAVAEDLMTMQPSLTFDPDMVPITPTEASLGTGWEVSPVDNSSLYSV